MTRLNFLSGRIPCMKVKSATVTNSVLTLLVPQYYNTPKNYTGLILFNIPQTLSGLTFTSVVVQTEGTSNIQSLINPNDVAISDITGNGIYLTFYDRDSDKLQLI